MKPNFEPGKWFMQCVGIDIAKSTFTACLCMYEFDQGCSTPPVVFSNNKTGFNQFVKWSRKEALKGYPIRYVMEPTGVYYEQLDDTQIEEWIKESYRLVASKLPKTIRHKYI